MSIARADASTRLLIERYAAAFGVNPNFLEALMIVRTGANPTAPTLLRPVPEGTFTDLSGSWQRLSTVSGIGNPGVRNIVLLAGQQARYFSDLQTPVGQIVVTTKEAQFVGPSPGSNVSLEVFRPDSLPFLGPFVGPSSQPFTTPFVGPFSSITTPSVSDSGTGNNTVIISGTPESPVSTGTYRVIVTAAAYSIIDLDFEPLLDPDEIRRFGIAQLTLTQARSVGFTGTGPDLEDVDVNLRVTSQILQDAQTVCRGDTNTVCLMENFLGVPSSAAVASLASGVDGALREIEPLDPSNPTPVPTGPSKTGGIPRQSEASAITSRAENTQVAFLPPCARGPKVPDELDFPMPSNPYFATFTITIGNFDLTPSRPQYVTYFEIIEQTEAWQELRIKIYDPDWNVIESTIIGNAGEFELKQYAQVVVTFGYATRNAEDSIFGAGPEVMYSSEPMTFFMSDYKVHFMGHGVEIELYCKSSNYFMGTIEENKTYDEKNPEDILRGEDFMERFEWDDLCYETSEDVEHFGVERAAYSPRLWINHGSSPAQFMQYVLLPNSKSVNNEHAAAYSQYFDVRINKMHAHPFPFGGPPSRHYTYGRKRVGAVINWKPQILGTANILLGGGALSTGTALTPLTGEILKHDSDQYSADDWNTSPNAAPPRISDPDLPGPKGTSREDTMGKMTTTPATNWGEATNQLLGEREHSAYAAMQGVLTIIGDPLIQPFSNIELTVQHQLETSDGGTIARKHPTSGLWGVVRITHVIQAGEYITILELMRTALFTDEGYRAPLPDPPKPENIKSTGDPFTLKGIEPFVLGAEALLGGETVDTDPGGQDPPDPFFTPGSGAVELVEPAGSLGPGFIGVSQLILEEGTNPTFFFDLLSDADKITFKMNDIGDGKQNDYDVTITPPPGTSSIAGIPATHDFSVLNTNWTSVFPFESTSFAPRGTWLVELSNIDVRQVNQNSDGDNTRSLVRIGVLPGETVQVRDLSDNPAASSTLLLDGVSGIDGSAGIQGVVASAASTQTFHFNPGSVGTVGIVIQPKSPLNVTVDVDPPSISGIGRRTVRNERSIRLDFGNGISSLNGTWRITVTAHADSEYTIYWLKGETSGGVVDLASLAPDGSLDRVLRRGDGASYGLDHVVIPNGVTKRWFASVKPPIVPEGFIPKRIRFQWYDKSDRGIGRISFSVEQLSGSKRTVDSGVALPDGVITYTSGFHRDRPDDVALGYYIVTATGVSSQPGGENYWIGWAVN